MRGLTATRVAADLLADPVQAILDAHLSARADRPVAVAFSGGGDSLALLRIATDWAAAHNRRLLVLTVDHGLQSQSASWTAACAIAAARLGHDFQALAWTGDKPTTGLAAAARRARHALIADAARKAGAKVILMGHTADDVREARLMRAAGATTPDPRLWAPSPAWPQGRGLNLLRPLLEVRRAGLRAWLTAHGETWIDDPANSDPGSARIRARQSSADPATPAQTPPAPSTTAWRMDAAGVLSAPRDVLRSGSGRDARRLIAVACVCAGGGDRRPTAARLDRAVDAVRGDSDITVTLAGARLEADAQTLRVLREPGEAARGGLQPLILAAGETGVWDGRFEIAALDAVHIQRIAGLTGRLPAGQRERLRDFAPKARLGLPAIVAGDTVSCPILGHDPRARATPLILDRFHAACGQPAREPD